MSGSDYAIVAGMIIVGVVGGIYLATIFGVPGVTERPPRNANVTGQAAGSNP
jgi:hypothetical protein